MDDSSRMKGTVEKRLERACEHVSDHWFPANDALVKKIRTGLQRGQYPNPSDLVRAIRADFSLFAYCLRELHELLKDEGITAPADKNAIELLEWSGMSRLTKILSDDDEISRHSLRGINKAQAARYQEALTSASTTEVLSAELGIDSDLGYSSALLRQLGYTLIAWNYPKVYETALASQRSDLPLDLALSQVLGFSPTMLAITMLRKWGVSDLIVGAVEENESPSDSALMGNAVGGTIASLCKIGEALARANDPEHYPSARTDWELAKDAITARLGADGLQRIHDRLAENCEEYLNTAPHIFRGGLTINPEIKISEHIHQIAATKNIFLDGCSEELRTVIEELYERMTTLQGELKDHLSMLVREIIPTARFNAGCIYTIDPGINMLIPQTRIGVPQARTIRAIDYLPYTSDEDEINRAFKAKTPVEEEHRTTSGTQIVSISGAIGHSQRLGVLYLEMQADYFRKHRENHLVHFKAITQTLNDCLGV